MKSGAQSTISKPSPTAHAGTECPKCHEQSIVRHTDGIYYCLSCDFKRNLSQKDKKDSPQGPGGFVAFLGLLWLLVLILL